MINRNNMIQRRGASQSATFVVAASDSVHQGRADYVCSGVDDQVQIQAAIDAAKHGAKIVLLEGNFWISAPITMIDKSVTLEGVGHSWTSGGSIFWLSPNSNCSMIEIRVTSGIHTYFPTIRNLMLHGKKIDQTGVGHGIHIFGVGVDVVSDAKIQDVGIVECNGHGILLETGWLNSIMNVWSEYNELDGLRSTDGHPKITNSHFGWNRGRGLTLVSRYSIVTASTISQNTEEGIYIQGDETIINGCRIFYNSQPVAGSYSGIKILSCSNISIVNNILDGESTQKYGILINDTVTDCIVANNQFFDHVSGGIQFWSPTNLRLFNNIGFVTENSGTATLVSGQTAIAVAHGLAVTPVAGDIMVTPIETLASASFAWIDTYTATQFTIHVNADPTQDVDFAWKAVVL